MNILFPSIFSEFKIKVLDTSYHPAHPLETLKARLTAGWLMQTTDPETVKRAKAFILKTSLSNEYDLFASEQSISGVQGWDELQVCSTYTNIHGIFLEYKLLAKGQNRELHFHARFEMRDNRCCFVSQTVPLIRVIGDPVLQKPGLYCPEEATKEQQEELNIQIEHAKSVLIHTGGAGIAANQCAAIKTPYQFTIVGVFHDIMEHASGVEKRYPGTKFPQAIIMVNPVITAVSSETQPFNHGCLSIPCANRCTVISPMKISARYLDPLDLMRVKELSLTGAAAVALWHELTHILFGKTYMDVTFDSLATEELIQFKEMVGHEIQRRIKNGYETIPELTVPPFHLSVKAGSDKIVRLDSKELREVLPQMTIDTLYGLDTQANSSLKKKKLMHMAMERQVGEQTFFRAEKKNVHAEKPLLTIMSKL